MKTNKKETRRKIKKSMLKWFDRKRAEYYDHMIDYGEFCGCESSTFKFR